MIKRNNRKETLESRITKLERKLHRKNESNGPAVVAIYECVGEGQLRWKDIADTFLELCDENMCMQVCDELGIEY